MNRSKPTRPVVIVPNQRISTNRSGDYRPGIHLLLELNGVKVGKQAHSAP